MGTRIALDSGGGIEVTQNCSGLSAFHSGVALAFLCLGFTKSWWRRIGIVLASIVMVGVYLIPHSLRGSELDYSQLDQGVPAFVGIKMLVTGIGLVVLVAYSQASTTRGLSMYRILGYLCGF